MSLDTDIQTFQPVVNLDNYLLFRSITAKVYLLCKKPNIEI